ncbi:MAG: hypothetical protein AAFN77_06555 [Planctomycetota bacterium]
MSNQLLNDSNDLVLRLDSGSSVGSRVAIKSAKCLLGFQTDSFSQFSPCAIVRGQQGAALQSLGDDIVVNGTPATVHWIEAGDRIEFPNSFVATVEQLGKWGAIEAAQLPSETQPHPDNQLHNEAPQPPSQETQAASGGFELDQLDVQQDAPVAEPAEPSEPLVIQDLRQPTLPPTLPPTTPEVSPQNSSLSQSDAPATFATAFAEVVADNSPPNSSTMNHLPQNESVAEPTGPTQSELEEKILGFDPTSDFDADATPAEAEVVDEPYAQPLDTLGESSFTNSTPTPGLENQNTANETVGESIDNLTHSLLADGSSFAVESDEPATSEAVSTLDNIDSIKETIDSELANDSKTSAGKESVAELLERMKAEGQWGGVPDDNAPAESISQPNPEASEVPQVEEEDVEEDVDSYMNKLLTRMRGGAEPEKKAVKPQKPQAKEETKEPEFVAPLDPLKPEEFIPKEKAKPIQSLGAMRELANNTARSAIQKSEHDRRKALGTLQIAIGVISFFMSLYYFLIGTKALGDVPFCIGFVCLIVAGFLAYRYYATMVHNEKVDAEEAAIEAAKQALGQASPQPANLREDKDAMNAMEPTLPQA